MKKSQKIIISISCILFGYGLLFITWGGIFDFGVLINTILFSCAPFIVIGGILYLIISLLKK